ncbi:autotransporter outer membrane beta-barrel domain-containing protein, partial [Alphaproteobacteria bacterium]|nr:autotransporter outer membrane beta-barrel domain-containing protein [Alphaproteobacteria bacterium]
RAYSAGTYGLSCTNLAYGTQVSSLYLLAEQSTSGEFELYGVYTGLDCAYSGGGRTNSSAIVGGEIARSAANAVVGAVSGRLSAAMSMDSNTAAHMSYSSNGNGIGMAANHLVGGLSVWTNFSSSNFENDQTFSTVRADSNAFDGDASAFTVGLDKRFGNLVVGVAFTSFNSDIDTTVNDGNIETEGETLGLYVGLNTGPLQISLGAGQGEYEIDTTRRDLGSDGTISANDVTADITYYHLGLSGELNRGKLSFRPRVSYRNFDLDLPAFTDIVPDDANTMANNSVTVETTTANEAVGGKTYSSDMSEAGLSIALSSSTKLIPFIDLAYISEDTTAAAYNTEATADAATADLDASAPDGYITYGGGLILNLQSKMSGYISVMETNARDDYSETVISGSLKLKF